MIEFELNFHKKNDFIESKINHVEDGFHTTVTFCHCNQHCETNFRKKNQWSKSAKNWSKSILPTEKNYFGFTGFTRCKLKLLNNVG